jgi:hypothetical protein
MADDVEIIIGADSSKLVKEVRNAEQELDRLRNASERLGRSSAEMDAAIGKAAKRLDVARTAAHRAGIEFEKVESVNDKVEGGMSRLAKAAALTGDVFGGMAGPIGDVGDAFAMMPAKTAAVVVGVGALVAAFGVVMNTTLDVITNIDDYAEAMDGTETQIYEARDSLDVLNQKWKEQKVAMAEEVAPAVAALSNAYISLSDNIGRAWEYIGDKTSEAIQQYREDIQELSEAQGGATSGGTGPQLPFILGLAWSFFAGQVERGNKLVEEQVQKNKEAAQSAAQWQASWSAFEQEQSDALKKRDADEAQAKRDRDRRREEAQRADEKAFDDFTKSFDEAQKQVTAEMAEEDAFAAFAQDLDAQWAAFAAQERTLEISASVSVDLDPAKSKMNNFKAHAAKTAEDSANVWKESADGIVAAAASFATTLTGMVSELASRNTANTRAERLKQFKTMKAAALVEASINTALGVTQSLGSAPFPANIVLGALTLAAGGVQIGLIASQQPNFHRGGIMRSDRQGLAGDERSFSATTRANEAVVLTQQAMGAFAGQLSRANAGEGMGGGMAPVYVMVDGRAAPTRQFARPDPLYGRRRLA